MTERTIIYLDFKGSIPEWDNVRECDWWIKVDGEPVTDSMLKVLNKHVTKVAKKIIKDGDSLDYYDLTIDAIEFMKSYGYKEYDEELVSKTIEVNI